MPAFQAQIHPRYPIMACSQDKDNIYTLQKGEDRMRGIAPVPFGCRPTDAEDSLLLHDPHSSQK